MIPYGKQSISEEDIRAVVEVLRSDWITQGPTIEKFEKAIAEYCGVNYAVAVANATAALHIACMALDLGSGDVLWTSPNTFLASANCARYCGADVDFVDIDLQTYNMSTDELEVKLATAKKLKKLPKIVIPVHFSGQSCEMEKIKTLAVKYGFKIVEDASHAIGGKYLQKPVGSCKFSDMTVFSFHPVKIITTGEGGIVTTNDKKLFERLSRLRSHGMTREQTLMHEPSHGPWYYEQIELGYNYRITDIQAALGLSQFQRIDQFVANRQEIAHRYDQAFSSLPITIPFQHRDTYSSYHLYVIRLKLDRIKASHAQVFAELRRMGIGVNLHYIPVYRQPYYRPFGYNSKNFPNAEGYYKDAISLPMYASLTKEDQNRVIDAVETAINIK